MLYNLRFFSILTEEISESVYLAKDYENVNFYQTVGYKFDSQLCTGIFLI